MSVVDYVKSLIPGLQKSQIQEDLRLLKNEYATKTIPPYEKAGEFFNRNKFISPTTTQFDNTYQKTLRIPVEFEGNYVVSIALVLKQTLQHLGFLEANVDKYIGQRINGVGLTYSRANFIRLIEGAAFFAKYSRKLLLWTLSEEEFKLGRKLSPPLSPMEMKWLMDNREVYFSILRTFARKTKKLKGALVNMPDMVVPTGNDAALVAVQGAANTDIFNSNIIPLVLNPIYHIGMAIAEYQAYKFKVMQEEQRALEYRILSLSQLRDENVQDPKLDQQIEYTEQRLKKLEYKLAQYEEDAV